MNAGYFREVDEEKRPSLYDLIKKLKEISLRTPVDDRPDKNKLKNICLSKFTEIQDGEYTNNKVNNLKSIIDDCLKFSHKNNMDKVLLNHYLSECFGLVEYVFNQFYTHEDYYALISFNDDAQTIIKNMIMDDVIKDVDTSIIINNVLDKAFELGELQWKKNEFYIGRHTNKKYTWKKDLKADIDNLLKYLDKTHEEINENFASLLKAIRDKNYVYLALQNQSNCTINSTFHIFINYLIWNTYKKIDSEEYNEANISENKLDNIKKSIREYLNKWFALYTINYNDTEAGKQLQEIKENLLDQLTDGGNFHLCMIDYYYLVLHIFVYCETALEAIRDGTFDIKDYEQGNLSLPSVGYGEIEINDIDIINTRYNQEFTQRKAFVDGIKKETDVRQYLRYSNKIGNIILEELFKKFGIIKRNDTLLLNDLKTSESDNETSVLETASKGYINAIVKYFNGGHSNVIFIKNNGDDKILIDDIYIGDNTMDKNKFYVYHVIAGIHVAHTEILKEKDDRNKSSYKHGEIVDSKYYIPTAFFFKGGAILSLLFIICIVAIVVCVVIYIHDRYWVNVSEPTLIGSKPKI